MSSEEPWRWLLAIALRGRQILAWGVLLGMLLSLSVVLLTRRMYTSTASFTPQTRRAASNLSGLAASIGFALPTDQGTQSPAFYADLIQTRDILGHLVDSSYVISDGGKRHSITLPEVYRVREKNAAARRDATIRALTEHLNSTAIQKTGLVRFSITSPDPDLSQQLARHLLNEVEYFNLQTRRSQAVAERVFTEQRLAEASAELRAAEDALQSFLSNNRVYDAPQLAFQRERLRRQVDLRQQVTSTLQESYEQARLEEVRDTPLITLVETPNEPSRPDSRGGLAKLLLGVIGGLLVSLAFLVARSLAAAPTTRSDVSLASLGRATLADLRRPWRLFRRASSHEMRSEP